MIATAITLLVGTIVHLIRFPTLSTTCPFSQIRKSHGIEGSLPRFFFVRVVRLTVETNILTSIYPSCHLRFDMDLTYS